MLQKQDIDNDGEV